MDYNEVLQRARARMAPRCKVCPECNGLGCGNTMPGPGSKAPGNGANDNWRAWRRWCLNMDTIAPNTPVDTSLELLGRTFSLPVIAAPIGSLRAQFHPEDDIRDYNACCIAAAAQTAARMPSTRFGYPAGKRHAASRIAAAEAGRKVELLQWSTLLDTVGWYTGNTFTLLTQDGVSTQIRVLPADDYGRLTGHTVDLAPDEVLIQAENLALPETFYVEDLPFHVAGTITDFPRYNDTVFISGQTAQLSLVVANETVASAVNVRDTSDKREFHVQMDLDGTEAEKQAFVDPLLAADVNGVYSVISRQDNALDLYTMYGGFLFLGVFLGLLFLLSTVLIIYYKQISEGYEDQRRYQIMQQVGMSPREVRSSIRSQVLLVFFLPLVMAVLHLAFAFPMLEKILLVMGLANTQLILLSTLGCVAVFALAYLIIYALTARTYYNIVETAA